MLRDIAVPVRLREQQLQLATHLRNPERHAAPPDIEEQRLKVYRELFFNNIRSLLAGMFPVICSLYSEGDWAQLVRDFYESHRCRTPYFPAIGEEFIAWLRDENPLPDDKPFLLELAHYEWVELALATGDDDSPDNCVSAEGDLLTGVPVVSSLCWPLRYRFPVHRIGADFQPVAVPEVPTCLIVYRNAQDAVCFVESNEASIRLIELLQKNHIDSPKMAVTGERALEFLANELQHPDMHALLQFGLDLLLTWRRLGIISRVLYPA